MINYVRYIICVLAQIIHCLVIPQSNDLYKLFFSLVWRTRNTPYASCLGKRDVRIEKYNPGLSAHFCPSVIVRCHLSRQEADLTWSRAGSLRALRIAPSGCSKPQRRDWLHRQLPRSPQAHAASEYVCWVSVTTLTHVWTGARHMSHGSPKDLCQSSFESTPSYSEGIRVSWEDGFCCELSLSH